jgi:tRNA(adenine34) deaminase
LLAVYHRSRCHASKNRRSFVSASPFMRAALEEAEAAAKAGEVPVGAVVVRDNRIIAAAGNRTLRDNDPTAHAEIVAMRAAATLLSSARLTGCDLYVTLEPCTMCAAAISHARIARLYFGASDPKGGAIISGVRFFASDTCHHAPEVYDGIAGRDAGALLRTFFAERR